MIFNFVRHLYIRRLDLNSAFHSRPVSDKHLEYRVRGYFELSRDELVRYTSNRRIIHSGARLFIFRLQLPVF